MEITVGMDLIDKLKWKLGEVLTDMDKRNEARYDEVISMAFAEDVSDYDQERLMDKARKIRLRHGTNSDMFVEAAGYALGMTHRLIGKEKDGWYKYFYGTRLYLIIIKDWLSQPLI